MNQERIDQLQKIATDYKNGIKEIESWCREVSSGLNFPKVSGICLHSNGLSFLGTWYGSYSCQSEETNGFQFDYCDLLREPYEIIERVRREREKSMREQYERLHQKFSENKP